MIKPLNVTGIESREETRLRVTRQLMRRQRRRALVAGTAVLTAVTILIFVVTSLPRSAPIDLGSDERPAGVPADSFGVRVGTGPVVVAEYFDYLCPPCRRVNNELTETIAQLINDGHITVEYHPIAILDSHSNPPGYSTRAASAAGCAAEAGVFSGFHHSLFHNQPAGNGPGLTDDQLIELAVAEGANPEVMRSCINDGRFQRWVASETEHATRETGVVATPTILVNGKAISIAPEGAVGALLEAVDNS